MAAAGFISVHAVFLWRTEADGSMSLLCYKFEDIAVNGENTQCFLLPFWAWAGLYGSSLHPLGISDILSKIGEVCYIKLKDKGLRPFFLRGKRVS